MMDVRPQFTFLHTFLSWDDTALRSQKKKLYLPNYERLLDINNLLCDHFHNNRQRYMVRSVAINLIALYIAYRVTMTYFLEEQNSMKQSGLENAAIPVDPTDLEF